MPKLLHSPYTPAIALALLGLVYRLILLSTTLWTVDSDQAVFGLMARHILRGERPIFYYGQGYQGALEAYLTAGIFRLWEQNDLLLRLVPTLFSILLLLQLYWLALRLYGRAIAVATGLWLALAPPVLVLWGTASGAGYIEVMTIGTALFAIAIRRWGLGHARRYDLPALGLLAGLGVWEQPTIAYYLVALAITWLALAWRRLLGLSRGARAARLARLQAAVRHAWPVPVCFVLGAAPWLGYTARHEGASLSVLSGLPDPSTIPGTVGRLLSEAFPILLGGSLPNTLAPDFAAYANEHQLTYALALLAMGVVLVRLLVSPGGLPAQLRALLSGRPLADAPLALLPLVTIALYLGSRFEALDWTTRNPRYLLPLYTATPYLFACVMPIATRAAIWRNARHGVIAYLGRRILRGARASGASPRRHYPGAHRPETGGDAVPCGNQAVLPFHTGTGETPAHPGPSSSHALAAAPPAGAVPVYTPGRHRATIRLHDRWRQFVALYRDGWRELWDLYRGGGHVLARPAAVVGLAVLLGINVYGAANFQDPARVTPLAAALVSRGDTAVYCYYWLAYRLAFESEERLTPVVTTSQGIAVSPRRNNNRYLPYLTQATYARRWAYILPYDVGVPQLLAALRRYHVPYQRWHWDNASVFDGPVRPGFPPDLKLQPAKQQR